MKGKFQANKIGLCSLIFQDFFSSIFFSNTQQSNLIFAQKHVFSTETCVCCICCYFPLVDASDLFSSFGLWRFGSTFGSSESSSLGRYMDFTFFSSSAETAPACTSPRLMWPPIFPTHSPFFLKESVTIRLLISLWMAATSCLMRKIKWTSLWSSSIWPVKTVWWCATTTRQRKWCVCSCSAGEGRLGRKRWRNSELRWSVWICCHLPCWIWTRSFVKHKTFGPSRSKRPELL